ncbi:MAG: hypothetical protein Q4C95_12470 [Planctomycetia bacterium]|nr:hypothetical protein [Planctomycetia bacterium]
MIIFVLLLVGFIAYFGSLDAAASWLRGESFSIEPRNVFLDNREPGTEEVVTFHLKNLTSEEISVVGEKSSCSCAFSENIPIVAKPKETVELKVRVRLPKYQSDYDQTILFMVATPKKLEMPSVRIVASIPNPLPMPDADGSSARLLDLHGADVRTSLLFPLLLGLTARN